MSVEGLDAFPETLFSSYSAAYSRRLIASEYCRRLHSAVEHFQIDRPERDAEMVRLRASAGDAHLWNSVSRRVSTASSCSLIHCLS